MSEVVDPVQRVLSIDEVLEHILEYAASDESWETAADLRLVCKRWRSLAFSGLCRCDILPIVYLDKYSEREEYDCKILMNPNTFKKFYTDAVCPSDTSKIDLPPAQLPIVFQINRFLTKEDVAFFQEFSSLVAHVSLGTESYVFDFRCDEKLLEESENLNLNFVFSNLRSLKVSWRSKKHQRWMENLVTHLVSSSKRLADIECMYSDKVMMDNPPKPPTTVTKINACGPVKTLQQLTQGVVKKLYSLQFSVKRDHVTKEPVCYDTLSEIIQNYSSTLKTLIIWNNYSAKRKGCFRISEMKTLESFETHIPFCIDEKLTLAEAFPKLKKLTYRVGKVQIQNSAVLKVSKLHLKDLEELVLEWHSARHFESETRFQDKFIKNLESNGLPEYPELRYLELQGFPYRVGLKIMPKVIISAPNITSLNLVFKRNLGVSRPARADTNDVLKMLTGLTLDKVPEDETLWSQLPQNKSDAITSLKHLMTLELETCERSKCLLGRFLFRAVFLKMAELREIQVKGGIQVNREMIHEWRSQKDYIGMNKSIHVSESIYHKGEADYSDDFENDSDI